MSDAPLLQQVLTDVQRRLSFALKHPIRNFAEVRTLRRKVQAIAEAQRDVLDTAITGRVSVGETIAENNYLDYARQVDWSYKMYDGLSKYGHEIVGSVVDIRVALIAGEGVSFYSDNETREKFIKKFLRSNKLSGSKLLNAVLMGELEGKALFTLSPMKKAAAESYVAAQLFSWYTNKYVVTRDQANMELIKSITYKKDNQGEDVQIALDMSHYVKLGGSSLKDDQATTKIGKVLTQCENASRAAYDLRANTHLFGRVMPYWETKDNAAAVAINNDLKAKSFEIGDAYAGTAKMGLLEPSGSSADAVIKDMLNSLRFIASMTGVPIHWLAWPELMSNRATAENMLEVTSAATKKERLIWEESLTDLIEKVCQFAIDSGVENDNEILKGSLVVKLPLISLAAMQQVVDVWVPLFQEKVVSMWTLRNMLPGIDPEEEEAQVVAESEEAAKKSPLKNVSIVVPGQNGQKGQLGQKGAKPQPNQDPSAIPADQQGG